MTRPRTSWAAAFLLAAALAGCRAETPADTRQATDAAAAAGTPRPAPTVSERVSTERESATGTDTPVIERRDSSTAEVFRRKSEEAPDAERSTSRRDLQADEQRGGHTIERHVGKSDDELRARLSRERQISAASTYTDLTVAEMTVARVLAQESRRIESWTGRRGPRQNLALDYTGPASTTIGRTLRRGARRVEPCSDAVVVLRWDERRGDYYVLTSYPERRR